MVSLRFPLSFNVSKITKSTVPTYMKKKYKIISLFYDIDDDDDDDDIFQHTNGMNPALKVSSSSDSRLSRC